MAAVKHVSYPADALLHGAPTICKSHASDQATVHTSSSISICCAAPPPRARRKPPAPPQKGVSFSLQGLMSQHTVTAEWGKSGAHASRPSQLLKSLFDAILPGV